MNCFELWYSTNCKTQHVDACKILPRRTVHYIIWKLITSLLHLKTFTHTQYWFWVKHCGVRGLRHCHYKGDINLNYAACTCFLSERCCILIQHRQYQLSSDVATVRLTCSNFMLCLQYRVLADIPQVLLISSHRCSAFLRWSWKSQWSSKT